MVRVIVILLLCFTFQVQAIDLENIKIDEKIQIDKYTLVLNGVGIRKMLMFKGFIGALYLDKKTNTAETVLENHGAKRMAYIMLRDVSGRMMLDKINQAIVANNTMEDMKQLETRFELMEKIFSDMKELKTGETIFMDYLPDTGTRILHNGVIKGTIEGEDFYRSLLRNWIGSKPVQASLKASVLGLDK